MAKQQIVFCCLVLFFWEFLFSRLQAPRQGYVKPLPYPTCTQTQDRIDDKVAQWNESPHKSVNQLALLVLWTQSETIANPFQLYPHKQLLEHMSWMFVTWIYQLKFANFEEHMIVEYTTTK